jgi:hypothetical protein
MRLGVGGVSFGAGPICTVSYREKVKEIKKLLMAQETLLMSPGPLFLLPHHHP